MTTDVEKVVSAVLYEGYILYPYRPSSVKNRLRWTFGGVHPRTYSEEHGGSEPWQMQTQCLLVPARGCRISVEARFLHLLERRAPGQAPWQEAREQSVRTGDLDPLQLRGGGWRRPLEVAGGNELEGAVSRTWQPLQAQLEVAAASIQAGTLRLTARISNQTPVSAGLSREQALLHSLVSAHAILSVVDGHFVSLTDPPAALREAAAACRNVGTWPVLIGQPGASDTMLSSPIILEDYPAVAEESPGDLFDSTEIDEILTLRILSLSDAEKEEMRMADEKGRRLLERTEALTAEELMRMHGTLRSLRPLEEE